MEESKPLLDTELAVRIDLADLIEREQIKTLTSLPNAIEALQARLVADLQALGSREGIQAILDEVRAGRERIELSGHSFHEEAGLSTILRWR